MVSETRALNKEQTSKESEENTFWRNCKGNKVIWWRSDSKCPGQKEYASVKTSLLNWTHKMLFFMATEVCNNWMHQEKENYTPGFKLWL
jgi:hypothetical protein